MIVRSKENKEFFSNGNLKYIENVSFISPMFIALYPNRRVSEDGEWIRTGKNVKYRTDGSIEWQINYDNYGNVLR